MHFTLMKIGAGIASLFFLCITIRKYQKDVLGIRSTLMWSLLFIGIAVMSLFPGIVESVLPVLGMKNRMVFVLLSGLLISYALLFNLTSRFDKLERAYKRLTQQKAIEEYTADKQRFGNGE